MYENAAFYTPEEYSSVANLSFRLPVAIETNQIQQFRKNSYEWAG